MPRFPQPWYRPGRRLWYVTIDGHQHCLGPEREDAFRRYHQLMAKPPAKRFAADSLFAVIDAYLDWCQKHRAADTFEWYRYRLQRFVDFLGGDIKVGELRPFHVQRWIDSYEDLASGSKRNYCRAIQRAMRWAEQQGYIDRSPIAYLEKPPAGKRETVVTQEEYAQLLRVTNDREFRQLLSTTWEIGCRPQELLRVEARHVDLDQTRWVFPPSEAKMGRLPRIVYLTEPALDTTRRLILTHPEGPLFRNTRGRPWTPDAVNCRFTTLKKKLGKRYCLYLFRHTWMNRLLKSGVDALTVAILAGHADPSMLAKTYQHLSQDPDYLRQAARRSTA